MKKRDLYLTGKLMKLYKPFSLWEKQHYTASYDRLLALFLSLIFEYIFYYFLPEKGKFFFPRK